MVRVGDMGSQIRRALTAMGDAVKQLWTQTLRAYRAAQWDQADVNLLNLQRADPQSTLYKAFSDIVADRRRNPPPADWDGVTVFSEK